MKNCLSIFICLLLFTNTISTSVFSHLNLLNFKENNQKLSSTINSLITKNNLLTQKRDLPTPESFNQNCANMKYVNGSYPVPKQMWYFKKKQVFGSGNDIPVNTKIYTNVLNFPFTLGYELMELNIEFQFSYFYEQDSSMTGVEFQLFFDDILIDEYSDKLESNNLGRKNTSITLKGAVYRVCPGAHILYLKSRRAGNSAASINQGVNTTNYVTMIGYVS